MQNALSFDIEEYFQVHAFETVVNRSDWGSYPARVVENTQRILRLLAAHDVKATFFILGWVAERFPELVREIAGQGHEIASHGYGHELIYRQSQEEFVVDLERSLVLLSQALQDSALPAEQKRILGYRAPSFSITRQSLWALDVIQSYGLCYDSSIFPLVAHDRYGISNARRFASEIQAGLWEFPVSTVQLVGRNWPVAGGGYFRLFPLSLTRKAIQHINREGYPAVIYLHPWEFDPEQPRIKQAGLVSKFRHYLNLKKTEERLAVLLQEFSFGPMRSVFADCLGGV
jgi:polysaccharide deacetylase family protein (PEP-CTERM system associated)